MENAPHRRVGILGGGQLGHFLCLAARPLDLHCIVLTPGQNDPAVRSADEVIVAPFGDTEAVRGLAGRVDVITFEIETIPPATLTLLETLAAEGVCAVAPRPQVLSLIQNKALQKQWMRDNELPTADFEVFDRGVSDPGALADRMGFPFVQKSQRDGYDGRGVQIIAGAEDLNTLWETPSLVEAFVEHEREIAVLVARGVNGDVVAYDPVALTFDAEDSILETASSPAALAPGIADRAMSLAERAVVSLDGIGLFAVELFVTEAGEVLVNEISPRVHNAGHHTIEACETSQFEQHLRAVTGLPLGPTTLRSAAAMRNVLFDPRMAPLCESGGVDAPTEDGAYVHWYGKREGRPKRKMGHITCLGDSPAAATSHAEKALAGLIKQGLPETS